MNRNVKNWLLALLLCSPMILFFLGYLFNHDRSISPTGFIQYDNISYIAYAKQYNEAGGLHLFYNNPFNDSSNYPAIYFQPQTVLFALLLKMGLPAGWILIPFTLLCTLICFRLIIAIVDHLLSSSQHRTLIIWLLAWGGGLLTFAGFIAQNIAGTETVSSIFHLDPGGGWWGLNLGRSMFFSCEAYYHALFLGIVLLLIRQRWMMAITLSVVLSLSHPFTGLELLCIITAWSVIERLVLKKKIVPSWFIVAALFVLIFHLYYYLYYLNQFADHRSVAQQYQLNWRLRFFSMIPAYGIVGGLALFSLLQHPGMKSSLGKTENRFFLTWFLIAFALANHELFMPARQPIHFTRGYIWTSLFLLGIPGLQYLLQKTMLTRGKKLLVALFVVVFVSDNISWIGLQTLSKAKATGIPYLNSEQVLLLREMKKSATSETLILSEDDDLAYLATVYTDAYSLYSHPFTTPFASQKKTAQEKFFRTGVIDPSWQNRPVLLLVKKKTQLAVLPDKLIIETNNYRLFSAKF